jgi:hypothetical protein
MTAICACDLRRALQLPLELNGNFYCGGCGGLFEGKRAKIAKDWWQTSGRINDEMMGGYATRLRQARIKRKGRKRAKKRGHRG